MKPQSTFLEGIFNCKRLLIASIWIYLGLVFK